MPVSIEAALDLTASINKLLDVVGFGAASKNRFVEAVVSRAVSKNRSNTVNFINFKLS